jgi:hypothetical protein
VHLLAGPLLPAPIWLLVCVTLWRGWCRLRASDEILGPFIHGDVESASQNNCSEVIGAFWSMARTKAKSLDPSRNLQSLLPRRLRGYGSS